jgi:hypothetical protein
MARVEKPWVTVTTGQRPTRGAASHLEATMERISTLSGDTVEHDEVLVSVA